MNIGIRREDKNEWEARVPLVPNDIKELKLQINNQYFIQASKIRAFKDSEFEQAGCTVKEDLSFCDLVFAVKEIPIDFFSKNTSYVFFSHTIKGQSYNMPILKRMMELKCNLIDYEKIVDHTEKRLIFFGEYAGLAGMIDSLWAVGKRFEYEGIETPFSKINQANKYHDLKEAKNAIENIGKLILKKGLNKDIVPFIAGITGYGQVSKGAQKIYDLLPCIDISPEDLNNLKKNGNASDKHVYKIVFKEKDMVVPVKDTDKFELYDYYNNPEKYKSNFDKYISDLSILVNCIYWDKQYPKLVTKKYLKENNSLKLKVIGDISCDIEGSIECNTRVTNTGNPVYVYNAINDSDQNGVEGEGVVILAVDNLPCELAIDSSALFSSMLKPFVNDMSQADFGADFLKCNLPLPIKKAVILYNGELTPDYQYISKYL